MTFLTPAPALDRRTLVKSALALGAAAVASPYVITARAADVVKYGFCNPLTGTYAAYGKNETIGCQLAIERNQRQGRHSRPAGANAGRGFHQRRRRHRGSEIAQADRGRQGRLSARQRELGARFGDGAGRRRKRHAAHRARRPHRRHHRQILPLERVPRLQHHADGGHRGGRRADQGLRQEVVLHHARLRLRPHAGGRHDQGGGASSAASGSAAT